MSDFIVQPSSLHGSLSVPASKSQTLRAILFGTLASGETIISNYLDCQDSQAMIKACSQLGARITKKGNKLLVIGTGGCLKQPQEPIDAGNSGIVLRFVAAVAALTPYEIIITGDASACRRPMEPLLDGLRQLGALAKSLNNDGSAPVLIRGPIRSGQAQFHGMDSQFVSALLIAAALTSGPTELSVIQPGEQPWVALTLYWLNFLGISYKQSNFDKFYLSGGSKLSAFEYSVSGDLSSAAFPIAAAVITNSSVTVQNCNINDPQGDWKLFHVLQNMGAPLTISSKNQIVVDSKKGCFNLETAVRDCVNLPSPNAVSRFKGMTLDINDYIDAIAILAVLGCFAEGTTRIVNAAVARSKESDRVHCLATELKKMGAHIEEMDDGLVIHQSELKGATLSSQGDHRLAMALTVAAMAAKGPSRIMGVDCINKTYPTFAHDMKNIGATIRII